MKNLNRRDFMKKTVISGAALSVVPRYLIGGSGDVQPSDKIRVAVIGTGMRMDLLIDAFFKQPDCDVAALCDVDRNRVNQFAEKFNIKCDIYGDYRRILENKGIDAVVVATPDHWHSPMTVEACQVGKDVYVEKPVSNKIPPAVQMVEAAKKYDRVVQVGTQQRSWPFFRECVKRIQDGMIGKVSQVLVNQGSGAVSGGGFGGGQQSTGPEPIPEGFDWEMFQGPAPRHPYSSARRNWRGYYDYGGGSITDWGVHHIDIVHMAMGYDLKGPTYASGTAIENPDPERVPGSWSVSFHFDDFLMTHVSCTQPSDVGQDFFVGGPSFFGAQGYAFVNRSGYVITPYTPPGDYYVNLYGGGRRQPPPFEAIDGMVGFDGANERASEVIHVRDWFDCIKSRRKPVCDMETGFYSSLSCLLGLQSIQEGRALTWDPNTKTAKKA